MEQVAPDRRRLAAAQSLPLLPDHDPVPPWPAMADPWHARVASSGTVAAHPEAAHEPLLSQFARRHIGAAARRNQSGRRRGVEGGVSEKSLRNGANHGLLVLAKALPGASGFLALERMQKKIAAAAICGILARSRKGDSRFHRGLKYGFRKIRIWLKKLSCGQLHDWVGPSWKSDETPCYSNTG